MKSSSLSREVTRDLRVSMIHCLRQAKTYRADVIVGFGAGAMVLALLGCPGALEGAMASRTVETREAQDLAEYWTNVQVLIAIQPRVGLKEVGQKHVNVGMPEAKYKLGRESPPCFVINPVGYAKRVETTELATSLGLGMADSLSEVPWYRMVGGRRREYWRHGGHCACGKRTYIYGECTSCLRKESGDLRADGELNVEAEPDAFHGTIHGAEPSACAEEPMPPVIIIDPTELGMKVLMEGATKEVKNHQPFRFRWNKWATVTCILAAGARVSREKMQGRLEPEEKGKFRLLIGMADGMKQETGGHGVPHPYVIQQGCDWKREKSVPNAESNCWYGIPARALRGQDLSASPGGRALEATRTDDCTGPG
jgi:hypothetical protein